MPRPDDGEDTIVVKGNYGWSNPASPDSNGSPLRISPSLAQSNTIQKLESPESPNEDIPSIHRSNSGSIPIQVSSSYTKRQLTMEERLQAMPEKRALPWRAGVEPGAEVETGGDSRRKQIRFGCLLATRGDIAPVPCNSCQNGRGKFQVCVILENYFKGACASCQLAGRPNKCSIKQSDDIFQRPSNIESQKEKGSLINEPQRPRSATIQIQTPEDPPSKRRRTNGAPERLRREQELGKPDVGQQHQQTQEIAPVQRSWAAVNAPGSTEAPQVSRIAIADSIPQNTAGWAAVNPRATPLSNLPMTNETESNGNGRRTSIEQKRGEEIVKNEEGSQALIDRLPKGKQRQVYGIISGLQGGILVVQRELDMLKKALGIDDEE